MLSPINNVTIIPTSFKSTCAIERARQQNLPLLLLLVVRVALPGVLLAPSRVRIINGLGVLLISSITWLRRRQRSRRLEKKNRTPDNPALTFMDVAVISAHGTRAIVQIFSLPIYLLCGSWVVNEVRLGGGTVRGWGGLLAFELCAGVRILNPWLGGFGLSGRLSPGLFVTRGEERVKDDTTKVD